jgi:hypothetical protein
MNYQLSTFIRVYRTSRTQHFACQNAGLLLVGFVQRRDGRRKPTILSASYSAEGSSHSICTDLESNLSCPFNYVRLAVTAIPTVIWGHRSRENSQVWRSTGRKRHRDGWAGFRLHPSYPRYYGHPAACQHDAVGSRAVTTLSTERKEIASTMAR